MAVNKVEYGGKVLIDLTGDTVTEDTLTKGITAHNAKGEPITGTNVCSAGVVIPDWNQNDETADDYIKNRPFYTADSEEKVFVEEMTVPFRNNGSFYMAQIPSTFEATVGDTYKVSWDGTVYECICVDSSGIAIIGNKSIVGEGYDTGEPFLINASSGASIVIATADTSASHTLSISGFVSEVMTIDSKYIHSFDPSRSNVSGLPTPDQIYDMSNAVNAYIGETTFSQLENKKSVFDYVYYSGTTLLRLRRYGLFNQDGTMTIGYTGVDVSKMCICTVEFCFDGSSDDSVLTTVNIKYPVAMYINSSTPGSTKKFRITVDDNGTISATEVT